MTSFLLGFAPQHSRNGMATPLSLLANRGAVHYGARMNTLDPSLREHGLRPPNDIEVRDTRTAKQRGVFALKAFGAGEIVEVCPVLWLRGHDAPLPKQLKDYTFNWEHLTGGKHPGHGLALGFGSLYNGANPANLRHKAVWDSPYPFLLFVADRVISEGEELTVNYSSDHGAAESVNNRWFDERGIKMLP